MFEAMCLSHPSFMNPLPESWYFVSNDHSDISSLTHETQLNIVKWKQQNFAIVFKLKRKLLNRISRVQSMLALNPSSNLFFLEEKPPTRVLRNPKTRKGLLVHKS